MEEDFTSLEYNEEPSKKECLKAHIATLEETVKIERSHRIRFQRYYHYASEVNANNARINRHEPDVQTLANRKREAQVLARRSAPKKKRTAYCDSCKSECERAKKNKFCRIPSEPPKRKCVLLLGPKKENKKCHLFYSA